MPRDNEVKVEIKLAGADKFQSDTNKALGSFGKSTSKMGKLAKSALKATAAGMLAVAGAATGMAAAMVKSASELEQNTIAFEAMLGSGEKAMKLINDLQEFAKTTPFEIGGIQDSAKQLIAYGFELEEIIPSLRTMGNLAAGVGQDKLPVLIRAMGQIRAKGKLMGQEVLQLTETGLPILEYIAKEVGTNVQDLAGNVADMDISFETVMKAMQKMEKARFNNLMVKQSQSLQGIWSNIKDTITVAGQNIAVNSGLFDIVKSASQTILDKITEWAPKIEVAITKGIEFAKTLGTNIAKGASNVKQQLANLFNNLMPTGIGGNFQTWFKAVKQGFETFVGGIAVQIEVIKQVWQNELQPALQDFFSAINEAMGRSGDEAMSFSDMMGMAGAIIGGILVGITKLITAFVRFNTWMINSVQSVRDWIAGAAEWVSRVPSMIAGGVDSIKEKIKGFIDNAKQWFRDLPGNLLEALGRMLGYIVKFVMNTGVFLLSIPQRVAEIKRKVQLFFAEMAFNIGKFILSIPRRIREFKNSAISLMQTTATRIGAFLLGLVFKIIKWFKRDIPIAVGSGIAGIKNFFWQLPGTIKAVMNSAISWLNVGLKRIIEGYNSVPGIPNLPMVQIPTFAQGGIVGGSSNTGDKVIARVNSGEMILNRSQQAALFKMISGVARGQNFNFNAPINFGGQRSPQQEQMTFTNMLGMIAR